MLGRTTATTTRSCSSSHQTAQCNTVGQHRIVLAPIPVGVVTSFALYWMVKRHSRAVGLLNQQRHATIRESTHVLMENWEARWRFHRLLVMAYMVSRKWDLEEERLHVLTKYQRHVAITAICHAALTSTSARRANADRSIRHVWWRKARLKYCRDMVWYYLLSCILIGSWRRFIVQYNCFFVDIPHPIHKS